MTCIGRIWAVAVLAKISSVHFKMCVGVRVDNEVDLVEAYDG